MDLCACGNIKDHRAKTCRTCWQKTPPTKRCNGPCQQALPIESFSLRKAGNGYKRRSRCDPCEALTAKANRALHPKAAAAAKLRYHAKHPAVRQREILRMCARNIGLDPDEICALFEAHDGTCDSCGQKPTGRYSRLSLDHNHKTGKFRGFICSPCNLGLGLFGDDPARVLMAYHYLTRN